MDPYELQTARAELQQELENLKSDAEYNARREREEADRAKALADDLKAEVVAAVDLGVSAETAVVEASLIEAQGTVTYYHDIRITREDRIREIENQLAELDATAERMKATLEER